MSVIFPTIPDVITVHLGSPDSKAKNVTVSFTDYIKNVASSEIYPTWNNEAIYANIYAEISYALNRVYTEFYRSKGYNFDITNNTAYDQKFIYERNIFDNISKIVDNIFNSYIRRTGFIEPLAAKYCNGTTVTCKGLSQWGSEDLANKGLSAVEILENYYGKNIEIVKNVPIKNYPSSYPGYPLLLSSEGPDVLVIQTSLNVISQNYPAIYKIYPTDGIFGKDTEKSVIKFQEIFNLTPDGIVGKATWYKMVSLYVGIKKLSELDSKGQTITGNSLEYKNALSLGDTGKEVLITKYFLKVTSEFDNFIPDVKINDIYDSETKNAVIAFQKSRSIKETGVVDEETWNLLYRNIMGISTSLNQENFSVATYEEYGGTPLKEGDRGEKVKTIQSYLKVISYTYKKLEPVYETGIFTLNTKRVVTEFQKVSGLIPDGIVGEKTWNKTGETYVEFISGINVKTIQFKGKEIKLNDSDFNFPYNIIKKE